MQDAEALVFDALDKDSALIGLLGGKDLEKCWERVYCSPVAPDSEELPRITLFEVINTDEGAADNKPIFSDVNIRVDIWSDTAGNLFTIANQVKQKLMETFSTCEVTLRATMYEDDTGIYHKPIDVFLLLSQE